MVEAAKDVALGTRSSGDELLGQGVRYVVVGAGVAGIYVLTTLLLSNVAGLPFQVALAIGFCVAIATHFVAQRVFVWRHESSFALPVQAQAGRYLVIATAQYALTALSVAVLPGLLGVPVNVVYLATVACVTVLTFVLLRTRVFHAETPVAGR